MPVLPGLAATLVLLLAAVPVSAQPAPPTHGPGNNGPIRQNSPMALKWRACNAAWPAESARSGQTGSNAKLRFIQKCMNEHRPAK